MKTECVNCPFNIQATGVLQKGSFDKLNANHATVQFARGDAIIKQGTYSTNVAFLRSGMVKLHLTGPTHEQIICLVKAPSYLGLPTTFGNKINQYSITAITKAEVCFIDMEVFRYLLKENDSFAYDIILDLCKQQLESYRRCANRTQKQTRGNVADVLIEMAEQLFESDTFTLPITQSEMGNLVDTSRETISRILSEFDKDGIIHVVGKRIEILNKNSLKLISQNG